MIRDNALAVSGLLDRRIGGPSVSPYQPAGLWEEVGFGGGFSSAKLRAEPRRPISIAAASTPTGSGRCPIRRWSTFDAPNREVCTDCRPRTNTPLQALVLLNDPAYVEAARVLGQRILQEGGATRPSGSRSPSGCARPAQPEPTGAGGPGADLRRSNWPTFRQDPDGGDEADRASANRRGRPTSTRPSWPPGRRWATCC